MKVTILVVIFVIFAFILGKGLNSTSYLPSKLDTHRIFLRTQYFGEGLGKIYENRFGLFYFDKVYPLETKIQTVFFSGLNPVLIFLPLYAFLFYKGFKNLK
jgi:hypothetical protein